MSNWTLDMLGNCTAYFYCMCMNHVEKIKNFGRIWPHMATNRYPCCVEDAKWRWNVHSEFWLKPWKLMVNVRTYVMFLHEHTHTHITGWWEDILASSWPFRFKQLPWNGKIWVHVVLKCFILGGHVFCLLPSGVYSGFRLLHHLDIRMYIVFVWHWTYVNIYIYIYIYIEFSFTFNNKVK